MTKSPRKRTAPRQSDGRTIKDKEINAIYHYLQDAVKIEYPDGPLPELAGPASILARERKVTGGGALPHPEDVHAVLERALATLGGERSKRPEVRYLRLALRRHVELGLSLDQAFGYSKVGRGAPPALDEERAKRLACAVFEQRFIKGRKTDVAASDAGKLFSVERTQALKAFTDYAGYALDTYRYKRIQSKRSPLWSKEEERRLTAYYAGQQKNTRKPPPPPPPTGPQPMGAGASSVWVDPPD
jgi:hypothetical protein